LDIGAHFGIWSAVASGVVGGSGNVVAIEPSPAFDVLIEHLRDRANVQTIRAAIGSRSGTVTFHAQGKASSGSISREVTRINQHFQPEFAIEAITVPIHTLDEIVDKFGNRPIVAKIDVEGYEMEVLRGAKQLLERGAVFLIEVHPPQLKIYNSSESELIAFIEDRGYCIKILDRNPNSIYTIACSPPCHER
jgi:FkbM family methyltransferase